MDPKENIAKVNQELNELHAEIAKWQQKMETSEKQAKKAQNMINDAQNKIAKNEDLKRDLEALEKEHPEGIYLSGALLMFAGSKSYYLYGASSNEFRDFLPNHHMQYTMMKYAREHGATTYDFGGTDNDPDKDSEHYGLWAFKKVWGTYLSEKIGEFDYILNQPLYQLIEQVKPRFNKS